MFSCNAKVNEITAVIWLSVEFSGLEVVKSTDKKLSHNESLYAEKLHVQAVGPSMKADSGKTTNPTCGT